MRKSRRFVALLLLVVPTLSCKPQPSDGLQDLFGTLIDHEPIRKIALASDYVVIGTVLENKRVGKPRPAQREPEVMVRLRRVQLSMERALRGEFPPSTLTFYYFEQVVEVSGPRNRLHSRLFRADAGQRYIFFLMREGSVFRSVGDIGNFSLPVLTGRPVPNSEPLRSPKAILEGIADQLLVPTPGTDVRAMANELTDVRIVAEQLVPRSYVFKRLTELLKAEPAIQLSACFELYRVYYGMSQCMMDIAASAQHSSNIKNVAREQLENQVLTTRHLERVLNPPATFDFPALLNTDSRRAIEDELTLLATHHQSVRVRHLACSALAGFAPGAATPGCPER